MNRMPDIYTYTEFRDNMPAHFKRLQRTDRPTVVTRNGKAAAVLMSMEVFEHLSIQVALEANRRKIAGSMAQFKRGRGVSADEAFAKVREEFGLSKRKAGKRSRAA